MSAETMMTVTVLAPVRRLFTALFLFTAGHPAGAVSQVDFGRDIRPLFARHCTACHGGVKAAGRISFLYRDKALAEGKSGARAVVPGYPEKSEVIRRVSSDDPDELMPQPGHGPRLSDREVGVLRQWIKEGAVWSEHWSFVPPREPPHPTVKHSSWARSKADQLVLMQMEAEGLQPSPQAPAAEWLRRVSLDLTGLPPSLEDHARYLQERHKNPTSAMEQVVDRLLASPRFGERWASVWLDLARYSDTYGFEKDPHRDIWPWRDWVIRAFNDDMPFDQFTVRQLAGDLLPNATADDLLATAFHRNTQNNTEGGTDDEEFRMAAVLDRVNTTWTAWNATTFGCVQCHAHPYDPFEKSDYYRFAAFFNNTEDCDQNDDFPRLLIPRDESLREEAVQVQLESRRLRERLNEEGVEAVNAVREWRPLTPSAAKSSAGSLSVATDGRIDAGGTLPIGVTYTLTVPAIEGMTALRIEIMPESSDEKRPPERGQILSKLTLSFPVPGASNQVVIIKDVIADHLSGPRDPRRIIEGDGGLGSYPVTTHPRWGVVILDRPLSVPDGTPLEITLHHGIASNGGVQGCALRHFRLSCSTHPSLTEWVHHPARAASWKEWQSRRNRLKEFAGVSVPVMAERTKSATRETREFVRGNRLTLDSRVAPGIPRVTDSGSGAQPDNRLDMARWLVSDRNPLAARVLVNRLWAELFGRGIVETLEDFGTSGARPSHPELLDHLALRMQGELGWSVKGLLRELALSSTYLQSSRTTPEALEKDPSNRFLSRGPRTRLTAEMVRDQALAVSGLLSTKTFGPPVYPPQPEGIWSTVYSGDKWNTSTNEDRFRRSIYTYARRTAGYPLFLTFDAPMRDACTARRIPSNTPLQALATLNDPAFLEMATALAARMEAASRSPRGRIAHGVRRITLDRAPRAMLESLVRLYEGGLDDYRADPDLTHQLGTSPERAAMVLVASTLLNLDTSLTR